MCASRSWKGNSVSLILVFVKTFSALQWCSLFDFRHSRLKRISWGCWIWASPTCLKALLTVYPLSFLWQKGNKKEEESVTLSCCQYSAPRIWLWGNFINETGILHWSGVSRVSSSRCFFRWLWWLTHLFCVWLLHVYFMLMQLVLSYINNKWGDCKCICNALWICHYVD